mgnify:CR=1 FL=1
MTWVTSSSFLERLQSDGIELASFGEKSIMVAFYAGLCGINLDS